MNSIYLKPSGKIYYVSLFLSFLVLSAIVFLVSPAIPINAPLVVMMLLAVYFIVVGAIMLYYQYAYIHVEDEMITVREGLITSKMFVIPFNKISEIGTKYALIDSLFGVGTVMIDTSGTSGVEIVFRNVPKEKINSFVSIFRRYKDESGKEADHASSEKGAKEGKEQEKPVRDTW